jgi:hypothetical protein
MPVYFLPPTNNTTPLTNFIHSQQVPTCSWNNVGVGARVNQHHHISILTFPSEAS